MKRAWFLGPLLLLVAGAKAPLPAASISAQPPAAIEASAPDAINLPASAPRAIAQNAQSAPLDIQTKVELLNPGAAPRQQLRFTPPAKTRQNSKITMRMDMTAVQGQQRRSISPPPMVMTIATEVTKVETNGDIHLRLAYTGADVLPDANTPAPFIAAMRNYLKTLVGLQNTFVIDSSGSLKKVTNINLPASLDPNAKRLLEQISSSLQQITAPIPKEAVGVGAKWRTTQDITFNGIALTQVTLYEIVNLQGNVVMLKAAIQQQAQPQELRLPGQPAQFSLNLRKLSSQGNTLSTIRLDRVMPTSVKASINTNSQMTARDTRSGQSTNVETTAAIKMTLDPQ